MASLMGKQLPKRRMAELCELTGKGASEISYRMQFAELCPTEVEVSNALETFSSWREIIKSFAKSRDDQDESGGEEGGEGSGHDPADPVLISMKLVYLIGPRSPAMNRHNRNITG